MSSLLLRNQTSLVNIKFIILPINRVGNFTDPKYKFNPKIFIMSKVTRFEDLLCWKEARNLANFIYDLFEIQELTNQFSLKNQLERAGISVMNNIAEGFGRYHNTDFIRFLNISSSSCFELKSMSYLLFDRKKIDESTFKTFQDQIDKTNALVLGFIKYLDQHKKK